MVHGRTHRSWIGTAATLALLALAAPAQATVTTAVDRGGVSVPRLTPAERRALDIERITARGASWGLIVRVRFKGDVRALGRGRLRSAMVAVILRPRNRAQRPSALATRALQETLRRTGTSNVQVVRDGRTIDFMILGSGLANVRRIEVRALASTPRPAARGSRGARGTPRVPRPVTLTLTFDQFEAMLTGAAADNGSVAAPVGPSPDPDICRLLREDARRYARQEEDRSNERIQAILRGQNVDDLNRIIPQIKSARSRLRPVLGRNRCFSINTSFGYEHFQGFTRICGDFNYDIPVALFQPGAYRLFRLNETTGVFEEVPGAFDAGGLRSFTAVGVGFRIEQYGTYKIVFKDRDLAGTIEHLITVPPPEPQQTRDCG